MTYPMPTFPSQYLFYSLMQIYASLRHSILLKLYCQQSFKGFHSQKTEPNLGNKKGSLAFNLASRISKLPFANMSVTFHCINDRRITSDFQQSLIQSNFSTVELLKQVHLHTPKQLCRNYTISHFRKITPQLQIGI